MQREGARPSHWWFWWTCWWHHGQGEKPREGEAQGFSYMLASTAWSVGILASSVHEMSPVHLPSKIWQCLETAFGLRFHIALKKKKKKTSKLEFFLFFTEQSAPELCAESHFLHWNLVNRFKKKNLAFYLHDIWIFIQLSHSLFTASILPRTDFIWFSVAAVLWKSGAWDEDGPLGWGAHCPVPQRARLLWCTWTGWAVLKGTRCHLRVTSAPSWRHREHLSCAYLHDMWNPI